MRMHVILITALLLLPINAYSQSCSSDELYGCGLFYTQHFPPIQQNICGCFEIQISDDDRGVKSCKKQCPFYDGVRTESGCKCLRGPVELPGFKQPALSSKELTMLRELKKEKPELYEIYIDTQLGGNNPRAPLSIENFIDLF